MCVFLHPASRSTPCQLARGKPFCHIHAAVSGRTGLEQCCSHHEPCTVSPRTQALQSSAGARLGAFGSLLGDKAAEAAGSLASAASLGDYLQPAAASSLLSSFSSRWRT